MSGPAFPGFAPDPGSGGTAEDARRGLRCRFAVLHDATHPSPLTLQTLATTA